MDAIDSKWLCIVIIFIDSPWAWRRHIGFGQTLTTVKLVVVVVVVDTQVLAVLIEAVLS